MKDITNTMRAPTNATNIVKLNTNITVPASAMLAKDMLASLIDTAIEMDKQIKAQEAAHKAIRDKIKVIIGDFETVIDKFGKRIATYNWIKGTESVDRDALRTHFADVYEVVKKVGAPTRRLELK